MTKRDILRCPRYHKESCDAGQRRSRSLRPACSALLLEGAVVLAAAGMSACAGDDGGNIFEKQQVCSSANNDQTEYVLEKGTPLPFAGLFFTYVEQVSGGKDIRLDIDCDNPSFSIETGHVIVHLTQEPIDIPVGKVARITNIDSDPDWANLDISVEDAR